MDVGHPSWTVATGLRSREEQLKSDGRHWRERFSGSCLNWSAWRVRERRDILLSRLEEALEGDRGVLIRRFQENKRRLQEEAGIDQCDAALFWNCAYERTTSTIPLPNEDMVASLVARSQYSRRVRLASMY